MIADSFEIIISKNKTFGDLIEKISEESQNDSMIDIVSELE